MLLNFFRLGVLALEVGERYVQRLVPEADSDGASAEPEGLRLYRSSPYREFPAGIIMEVDATRAGRVSPLWAARVQQALGGQDE